MSGSTQNNDKQQSCDHRAAPAPNSHNVSEPVVPSSISYDDLKNDIDELKKRFKKDEKWAFIFSFVIAFSSACSVWIANSQLETTKAQLSSMDESGKQTDSLIREATSQSQAANRLAEVAKTSLAESRRQFQCDQRPYIFPTVEPASIHPPGSPLTAKLFLVNYGKSPAFKVSGYAAILIGKDALKQADEWFASDVNKRFNSKIGTIIPPGIPNGLNREKYTSLSSKKIVSVEDSDLMNSIDNSVVIVMRHSYVDNAGTRYGTDTCYTMQKTWQAGYCERHNETYEIGEQQHCEGSITNAPVALAP